jgi:hypothetical protein
VSEETPRVPKGRAIAALRHVLADLDVCKGGMSAETPKFKAWMEAARATVQGMFGESDQLFAFDRINFSAPMIVRECYGGDVFGEFGYPSAPRDDHSYFQAGVEQAHELLSAYIGHVDRLWPDEPANANTQQAVDIVVRICDRFDVAARRLLRRREGRPPLDMVDEYDVQYLLGAILDVHFEDIEHEACVPSRAGGASRIDFVLRPERIAIEAKRTRRALTSSEAGKQLLVDIARYNRHDGVDTLVCFVYDPERRIRNPRGLERDLESTPSGRLKIRALVRPQ